MTKTKGADNRAPRFLTIKRSDCLDDTMAHVRNEYAKLLGGHQRHFNQSGAVRRALTLLADHLAALNAGERGAEAAAVAAELAALMRHTL